MSCDILLQYTLLVLKEMIKSWKNKKGYDCTKKCTIFNCQILLKFPSYFWAVNNTQSNNEPSVRCMLQIVIFVLHLYFMSTFARLSTEQNIKSHQQSSTYLWSAHLYYLWQIKRYYSDHRKIRGFGCIQYKLDVLGSTFMQLLSGFLFFSFTSENALCQCKLVAVIREDYMNPSR